MCGKLYEVQTEASFDEEQVKTLHTPGTGAANHPRLPLTYCAVLALPSHIFSTVTVHVQVSAPTGSCSNGQFIPVGLGARSWATFTIGQGTAVT